MKPALNNPSFPDAWELLHALPSALLVVNDALQVIDVNDAAEQLFGTSRKQLCAQPMPDAIHSACKQSFERAAMVRQSALSVSRPSQPALNVQLQACPVFDADHPSPCAVMVLLEPASTSTQRQSDVASVMAAMLAHEVKNPLSGIRGAAQILGKKLHEADRPLTELICREVDRITALLQRMEFFSNAPASCDDAVNIHEVLEMVREAAQSGFASHVSIETRYDPSLPPVRGNKDLLVQLFMNLLKNAAEALQGRSDGRIVLHTRYQLNHTVRDRDGAARSLPIAITVEDNAGGIAESIKEHMFKPFVTGKTNGSGLGLAICARIATDHKGKLDVNTAEAGKTMFVLQLATL